MTKTTPQKRLEAILGQLSLEEVADLLSAKNLWHTTGLPSKGVPSLRVSDGPNGIRGIRTFNGSRTTSFPCAAALASTWSTNILEQVGDEMACQAKAKGVHVVLAPTVNIHRSPLGGRNFESFSEDPVLSGNLASSLVRGLQKQGISATVKHFVCNDQETDRTKIDVIIQERPLREIYLKVFQIIVREANPWAIMASYNSVNGLHMSENERFLDGILRKEWGWSGLVMSDWFGTYSTTPAINAGLDLEMPGPSIFRGERIARSIGAGKVEASKLMERGLNVLRLVDKVASSGVLEDAPELEDDSPKSRELNRKAAGEAVVLLKNSANFLPLKNSSSIAIIGPNAKKDVSTGGGSASLFQYYYVSAFDGIKSATSQLSPEISLHFAQGCFSYEMLPLLETKRASGEVGLDLEFFDSDFRSGVESKSIATLSTSVARMVLFSSLPPGVGHIVWARCSGTYTPEADGDYEFGIVTTGRANLFVDGKLLVNNWENQERGTQFFGYGTKEVMQSITLKGGKGYQVTIEYSNLSTFPDRRPADIGGGALRIGVCRVTDPTQLIAEAVEVASKVDTVILCLGTDQERESEGFDRADMKLPGLQNKLAEAVLSANPHTVIVNFSGSPIEMPWVNAASTILQAWFLGSELGNAISDVLFGKINPSGKLPVSFPQRLEQNPSYGNFPGENGHVTYAEGLLVGYRYYNTRHIPTLFPFGHGLSYTTFEYDNLSSDTWTLSAGKAIQVSADIRNTGATAGHEIVQLYISAPTTSVFRPLRELQAFQKVRDLSPGESATVTFTVDKYSVSFFDDKLARWVAEAGNYEVQIGASVEDVRLEHTLVIEETFSWVGV